MKKRVLSLFLAGIMFFTYPSVAFAENIDNDDTILFFDDFSNTDITDNSNTDITNNTNTDSNSNTNSNSDINPDTESNTGSAGSSQPSDDSSDESLNSNDTTLEKDATLFDENSGGSTFTDENEYSNKSNAEGSKENIDEENADKNNTDDDNTLTDEEDETAESKAKEAADDAKDDILLISDEEVIESVEPETVEVELEMMVADNLPDEDELFSKYVDRTLGVNYFEQSSPFRTMLFRRISARNSLSDLEKIFYDKAYDLISSVSSGNASDTKITLTPEELGLSSSSKVFVEDLYDFTLSGNTWSGSINSAKAEQAYNDMEAELEIDQEKIVYAIISDHPELLYWFGHSYGIGILNYSYRAENGDIKKTSSTTGTKNGYVEITSFQIAFNVSQSYALYSDETHYYTYKADTAKTSATSTALANAQAIADSYADLDDLEKLLAFKEKICSLVTYNTLASLNSVSNMGSDPWELIYVFDDDPSTNVVCEGYSKAFQYLCDISSFNSDDLYVLSVTGDMYAYSESGASNGGPHMWNIVHYDGKKYLTDVTNCDEDSIPEGNMGLYMKGYTSGDVENGYIITQKLNSGETKISYTYSSSMLNLYSYDLSELALSDADYYSESQPDAPYSYTIIFNYNTGNYGRMANMSCINGQDYQLSANIFTKDSYTFTGWNTKADGTGTSYADKATVKDLATADGQTITLYAQWEKNQDTHETISDTAITQQPESVSAASGTSVTFQIVATGVKSYQWQYKTSGSSNWSNCIETGNKTDKLSFSVTSDSYDKQFRCVVTGTDDSTHISNVVTVKQLFKYTISFNNNSGSGYISSMYSCVNGTEYTLTKCTYTKKCNKFIGWNTKADGTGTSYADQATVKDLATAEGQTITLYAQWKIDPETCDHSSYVDGARITTAYVITKEATVTEPGHIEKRCDYCKSVIESKDIHPYDTYRIEKGDGTYIEVQGYFDHASAKELWNLTNAYRKAEGLTELSYNDCIQDDSDTRALERSYSNSIYRPNGQSWDSLTIQWKNGAEIGTSTKATPAEVLEYWKSDESSNSSLLGTFASSSVGCFHVVSFSAKNGITEKLCWTQEFTMKDSDDESFAITKQPESALAAKYGNVIFQITATGVKKYQWQYREKGSTVWSDCTENGYNTEKLSFYIKTETDPYYDKQFRCVVIGTNGSTLISDIVTVTPKITYTIQFNNNTGSGYMVSMYSCVNETDYALPECTLTKLYSTFVGWNTKADGTGTSYADKATVRNLTSTSGQIVTLYAQWKVDKTLCEHKGSVDGKSIGSYYVTTKKATKTEWGHVEKRCDYCDAVLETKDIHPYDTYKVIGPDGTVHELQGYFDYDYAHEVWGLTNQYRKENGLNELLYNDSAQGASDIRALESAVYFSHTRPNGTRWNTVTSKWKYGGENLASGQISPSSVMASWKASPAHNANLLYGIEEGSTPYVGVSISCFHQYNNFSSTTGIPSETLVWGQHFTFYDVDDEQYVSSFAITKQPQNVKAAVGGTAVFEIETNKECVYEWYYSDDNGNSWNLLTASDIDGYNNKKISIPLDNNRMKWLYRCTVISSSGKVINSNAVGITADPTVNLAITKQPVDVTASIGENAIFSITATGASSYQWVYSKNGGNSWSKSSLSGYNTDTFTVPVTQARYSYLYRCTITGADGQTINSNPVVIKPALAITKQPSDVTAAIGENAIFKITALGASSYQWIYSTNGGNSWSKSGLSGYNTDTFTVPVTKGRYSYIYKCTITGADGQTLNSNPVVIIPALAITKQPSDVTAAIGENAIFKITALGASSYQWVYSKNGGTSWSKSGLSGYNTATFTVPVTKARYGYIYRCTITSEDGQTLNSASVVIKPKFAISKQPTDATAAIGENAVFKISAYGASSYQWVYSKNGGTSWSKSGLSGYNTATFTVPVTQARYGYIYRCTITSEDGQTLNSASVVIKPKFTISKQPTDVTAAIGENAVFKISAYGASSYQWVYSKNSGTSWSKSSLSGYNTDTFTVPVTNARYSYIYRCTITSEDGQTFNSNPVVIIPALAITKQPSDVTAAIGENAIFKITALGASSYQWVYSKNGGTSWSKSSLSGYNTDTFTIPVTNARYSYIYRCTITSEDGQTLNSTSVVIKPKYAISKQPTDVTAAIGENAVFKISAYGASSYQWVYSKNGGTSWSKSGLSGYNTATFTVPVTKARYGYIYRCIITGTDGKTLTSNMVVIKPN